MTLCNTNLDCPIGLDYCHVNQFVSDLNPESRKSGICAPLDCSFSAECPSIGNVCGSGAVSGSCQLDGKCSYDSPLAVAGCVFGNFLLMLIVNPKKQR